MGPIRRGDRGGAVRDIQRRLVRLGYDIPAAERAHGFGPGTEDAVRAFQQKRGVVVDGIVGADTWRELVDASWTLGSRVLYLRAPHFTGDDVRGLQDRLGTLGFDCGRVDGVFGAGTDAALREFQRNYGLPPDGVVGHSTVRALAGLPSISGDTPISNLREREAMRALARGLTGLRVVLDPGHGGADPGYVGPGGAREDEVCFALATRLEAALAAVGVQVYLTRRVDAGPPDDERAALANTIDAEIYLAIHLGGVESSAGCVVSYFGHERFHSEAGMRLAELVRRQVEKLEVPAQTRPMMLPVLRETRMPAVVIQPAAITDADDEARIVDASFQSRLTAAVVEALRVFTAVPAAV